jgi:hypothetical protein
MVNCQLELLMAATQTILMTSFTDTNGQYYFYTDIDPARLAIRARGQSMQLLGPSQGVPASPATATGPAPTPPVGVLSAYPLLETPAPVSS